jgi:hypothetical protein
VAPERIERGSESLAGPQSSWSRFSRPLFDAGDWLRRGWNDFVLGFTAARQRTLLKPFGIGDASGSQLGLALAVATGLALGITALILLRPSGTRRDALARAYSAFVRRLARAGLAKASHEPAMAYAARIANQRPELAESVATLSQRYARQRYAAQVNEGRELSSLCKDLRHFRVTTASASTVRRSR